MTSREFMVALAGICIGLGFSFAYRWKGQEYGHWHSYKRKLR